MGAMISLVRGDDRYANVSQSLALIAGQVSFDGVGSLVVKPNLVGHRPLSATHIDALRAVLGFVRARYDGKLILAEGAALHNTLDSFEHYGFDQLASIYDFEMVDLNADAVVSVEVRDRRLRPQTLRIARTVVDAGMRISVGPPKTHDAAIITCAIKNMVMGTLVNRMAAERKPEADAEVVRRPRLRLLPILAKIVPYSWRYSRLAHLVAGRMAANSNSDKYAMHQSYPTINLNIAKLAPWVWPDIAVVDGYIAMEGAGPTRGDPVDWRVALAGTDALAVDSMVASLMGFDPAGIGYLSYCRQMGLGEGDVAAIETVGNVVPSDVRRQFRPHPAYQQQMAWPLEEAKKYLEKARVAAT